MKPKDIRLIAKVNPDKVFTRNGDKVEITDYNTGHRGTLIYGHVLRGEKKIPHYWQPDGSFKNFKQSSLDLTIKQ